MRRACQQSIGIFFALASLVAAQEPIFLAEAGGVSLNAIPVPAPDGFSAAILRLISPENTKMATFAAFEIAATEAGPVHSCLAVGWCTLPTSQGTPVAGLVFHEAWIPYDSHVIFTRDMVGGGAGASYSGITETNDARFDVDLPRLDGGFEAAVGIGFLGMTQRTDAFFLSPEFQSNSLDFAKVVVETDAYTEDQWLPFTLGVLGEGIVNYGEPGGAFFDGVLIQIPEPSSRSLSLALLFGVRLACRKRREILDNIRPTR